LLACGALVGGRCLVVFNNEWAFYGEHVTLIPAIWIGGLASHGVLFGGGAGVLLFCRVHHRPFRPILDALVIPAAFIMGCGRIGNFIDGQIVGSVTSVPWAVKFPEAEGFRHPVVLYDGLKNFLLVPILLWLRNRGAPPGRVAAWFVVLYPALRIPIDLFREYPITMLGLPTGQTLNILMTLVGLALLARNWLRSGSPEDTQPSWKPLWKRRRASSPATPSKTAASRAGLRWRAAAFTALLAIALIIPSDATRDIPAAYGRRHPGLAYSALYPRIE
jgi:phosphatidylglycerol:prolipoprotein diacylglycerol transferase